jgi:hypothetical protein
MLDISAVLEEIKASPYNEMTVCAPYSGIVRFPAGLNLGDSVYGPLGVWREKPGTVLASIERERNVQSIFCLEKGEIVAVHRELDGAFVEAGTELVQFRHFLSKEEVVQAILKQALYLFLAPERAKYYFVPAVDAKIKVSGPKVVTVQDGEEIFIMSRMKREASLRYSGPEGVIYALYFSHNQNVDSGAPLIGVCSPDMVEEVEEVVLRVQTEWKEKT